MTSTWLKSEKPGDDLPTPAHLTPVGSFRGRRSRIPRASKVDFQPTSRDPGYMVSRNADNANLSIAMYVLLASIALAIGLLWQIISTVFLSPLRSIPGPAIAKITPKWLMLVDLAGNRTMTIHQLHQKYGPSVRIGPREISYSNPEMVKELYGPKTAFMKAPIYDEFSLKPLGIFSMRDRAEHSQRRRLLSHAFSQANLFNAEPLIKERIHALLDHVAGGLSKPLDMLSLFRMTAFDIVGVLFLGQSFGGLDSPNPPQFLLDMDSAFLISGLQSSFPWLYEILKVIPVLALRSILGSRQRLIQYGKNAFDKYIAINGRNSSRRDLLTKILTAKTAEEAPLTDQETYTEIGNLVFAGTDTTSTTLTYLFWELSRHPNWQTKLRNELLERRWEDSVPTYKAVVDLPVLDCVINEALRLHPAAPASLQRETPSGGRTLNGLYIPEKTVVSMQCYTTQRDPTVFSNPNDFLPERWMNAETVTDAMKTLYMPFSQGSRACLGRNLALMELKMITAALVRDYKVDLARGTTEDSMTMKDHFLAMPRGGRCDLVFSKAL